MATEPTAADFARLLAVAAQGQDLFLGSAFGGRPSRTFGGVIAAQALAAAAATAPFDWPCHALHLFFLAPGDADRDMTMAVQRVRDGRSFAMRDVTVEQGRRELARALVSFHAGADGPRYAVGMPEAPAPPPPAGAGGGRGGGGAPGHGAGEPRFIADTMFDLRIAALPADRTCGIQGRSLLWFRARVPLEDCVPLHQAALAFVSDVGLVFVGLRTHQEVGDGAPLDTTSLDHSIRFHDHARADEWLLFEQRSPILHGGRGFATGSIFTRDGRLVASISQEFLARYKDADRSGQPKQAASASADSDPPR